MILLARAQSGRLLYVALVVLSALLDSGCASSGVATPTTPAPREWLVFDSEGYEVMVFSDKSGPVMSTAEPPWPPQPVSSHPFMSGYFVLSNHEPEVWELIMESESVEQFLTLLHENGFRVERSE